MKLYRIQEKESKLGFYGCGYHIKGYRVNDHKPPQHMSLSCKTFDLIRSDKYRFFFTSKDSFESAFTIFDAESFNQYNEIVIINIDDELFNSRLAIHLMDNQAIVHKTVVDEYIAINQI